MIDFEFVEHKDGTWHLIFEDSLHGDDIDIRVNPDGTFVHCYYEDTGDDEFAPLIDAESPIENIYKFLVEAYKKQMDAIAKWERRRGADSNQ